MASALVLSYWDLNEAASGGSVRIHALLNVLGRRTILVQPRVHHPTYDTVPFPRDLGQRKIGINWGIFNFQTPSTRRIVRGMIDAHQPAVIVLTSIWNEPPLRTGPRLPMVLDAHDVNATAIAERFGAHHPFTRLVQAQEARAVHRVDHVFACSDPDREQFIRLYSLPESKVSVVPNGVDVAAFDSVSPSTEPDAFWKENIGDATALFFMGKLDYQPNVAALAFLNEGLMPELEERAPGRYKLLVSGGPVPPGDYFPAVKFAGRLPTDQLRQYVKRSDICLAPVFTGSGTRLKILEYMAAGRPIVSTPKGAEGLSCTSGKELLLAEPEEFADTIEALHAKPDDAKTLGQAAHAFVRDQYDWRSIENRWRSVLARWIPDFQ